MLNYLILKSPLNFLFYKLAKVFLLVQIIFFMIYFNVRNALIKPNFVPTWWSSNNNNLSCSHITSQVFISTHFIPWIFESCFIFDLGCIAFRTTQNYWQQRIAVSDCQKTWKNWRNSGIFIQHLSLSKYYFLND